MLPSRGRDEALILSKKEPSLDSSTTSESGRVRLHIPELSLPSTPATRSPTIAKKRLPSLPASSNPSSPHGISSWPQPCSENHSLVSIPPPANTPDASPMAVRCVPT